MSTVKGIVTLGYILFLALITIFPYQLSFDADSGAKTIVIQNYRGIITSFYSSTPTRKCDIGYFGKH